MKFNKLIPMPKDVLHGLEPVYKFMEIDLIEDELLLIESALPNDAKSVSAQSPTQQEIVELLPAFDEHIVFAHQPKLYELKTAFEQLQQTESLFLYQRVQQVKHVLLYVRQRKGADFEATTVLAVPPQWSKRWSMMFFGEIFPAYIAKIDLNNF